MLSKDLELTLNQAFRQAHDKRYEYLTVELLLQALLDNEPVALALRSCGSDLTRLRFELGSFIAATTPLFSAEEKDRETQPTPGFQRVLQRAIFQVQSTGSYEVTGINVLAAIFGEQESQAVYFLRRENITRLDILNYMARTSPKEQNKERESQEQFFDPMVTDETNNEGNGSPLECYAINLNAKARSGKIDPLVGRDEELARMIQILCRRRKNNPLLVGEAGVGKTAIVEGLALAIINGNVPEPLKGCTIYTLDLGSLLAGTKYRGDFEKRFKALLWQVKQEKGAILFIDEIHAIIGAGAASGGVLDASNLIKPLLSSGELRCMGATTYQEYRGIFEKDRALARRFQKIDIAEPGVDETIQILHGLKTRLENHHQVKYSNQALRASAELAARYLPERYLPDKAIDVVDEAGAYQALQPLNKRKKLITVNEIEAIVARMARIPTQSVSASDKTRLRSLEQKLKMQIFGQEHAVEMLAASIKLARSGLRELQKPIGSFLLAGPTGVGKTEVARQLAKLLGLELLRFDMSEYMERHTVSRLIGAPPGYIGYDQGGLLTDAIMKHPHAVLLLDEIEKAHPDVFNLLLQVMDHGMLTDTNGHKTDFRHIIIIMTTNAGADLLEKHVVGFKGQQEANDNTEAIKHLFSPEFRNRLDAVIQFQYLTSDIVAQVVDKFIMELEIQLGEKDVVMEFEPSARTWLAQHGYDRTMGARPMARLIQEKIKKPLAEELLFGKLTNGGHVRLTVANDEILLIVDEKEVAAA